ncbi:hypothetical protein OIU78_028631 [Salix suchowensis]|nr:hypothetical protein OIU78_028631 [Salix suchowensis]
MRLYELLQMESCNGSGSASISVVKNQRSRSWNCQPSSDAFDFDQTLQKEPSRSSSLDNCKGEGFSHRGEDPTTSGEDGGIGLESGNLGGGTDLSVYVQRRGLEAKY